MDRFRVPRIMAAPVLLKVFNDIYADPFPRLQLFVLGILMWYRTGLLAVLSIRKMEGINFGFVPGRKDWAVGIAKFCLLPSPGSAALAGGWIFSASVPRRAGCCRFAGRNIRGDFMGTCHGGGVLFPRAAAAGPDENLRERVDWPVRSLGYFRSGALMVPSVPELAIRGACHMRRAFLWAGLHPGPQHSSGDGNARLVVTVWKVFLV